jgi:TonB family protein
MSSTYRLAALFGLGSVAMCLLAPAETFAQEATPQQSAREAIRYNASGMLKAANRDFDGAIADYSEAIRLDPLFGDAVYNRGLARASQGDFDGAAADIAASIVLTPTSRAFYNLGRLKIRKDDLVGAITDFSQGLAFDANDAALYLERGRAERRHGDLNAASLDFERARALDVRLKPGMPQKSLAREGRYRVGYGVTVPKVVREVKPRYTSDAMLAKVQGSVLLECVVDVDGTVSDARVERSLDPVLDIQALNAARQWQFEPGTKDGMPVPVVVVIELTFTLK